MSYGITGLPDYIGGPLRKSGEYKRLLNAYRGERPKCTIFGMPENAKMPLLVSMFQDTGRSMLIVCVNDYSAQKLFNAVSPTLGSRALLMPARTVNLSRAGTQNNENQGLRAAALYALASGQPCMVIAGVDAARAVCVPPENYRKLGYTLKLGDDMGMEGLIELLADAGYERVDAVDGQGQFSVRGGIVDVFIPGDAAYRVDFFGDELDSIRVMDTLSQRGMEQVGRIGIVPAHESPLTPRQAADALVAIERAANRAEGIPLDRLRDQSEAIAMGDYSTAYEALPLFMETHTAADYLPQEGILVLDEASRLDAHAKDSDIEISRTVQELKERNMSPCGWERHMAPYAQLFSKERPEMRFTAIGRGGAENTFMFDLRPVQPFHGRMDLLADDLRSRKKGKWRCVVVLSNEKRCENLHRSLDDREVESTVALDFDRELIPGEIIITAGKLGAGFEMSAERFYVVSESEAFRAPGQTARRQQAKMEAPELKEGDYAVHDAHGIGIYRGMTSLMVDGRHKDVMLIEYRDGDKLYIPAEQMGRVQKYIGSDEAAPKLNRMGGAEWDRAKAKVSRSVKQLAQDLVAIYAQRQASKGYAFSADTPWQSEFEQAFPFEETEGQQNSIEEIKADMESPRIMDRLLCGDVGYGKTEVAMRAAFKCAMDARQTMFLVPTTILAQQHYTTMAARFEGYPVRVDVLSRFKTAKEQREVIRRFAEGDIDVLIGTHRLLGKDVKPYDLGLLVIDEEQRFGVGHKETIKDLKRTVDVLTMTATPIPRTLEMSLVGIRDMSTIHTAPDQRYPINTYVVEYSDELLREVVTRELSRSGQAYVLYNNVRTMERFVGDMRQLVPEARITMAHGQMPEQVLETAMMDFYSGEADVLVCSTIIENGLDIPSANSMLIYEAEKLGLAQLYQLRGRVGRSPRSAYCYLTYRPFRQISETAEKRLEAIREFTELGSGLRIAMRDLEIRGAGNMLGPEQHGYMANVGYDTYCKLLAKAVKEAKGDEEAPEIDTSVDVPLEAYIPEAYITSKEQKVNAYRRIADIDGSDAAREVMNGLKDRYGRLPTPVENLIAISLLRAKLNRMGILSAVIRPGSARLKFAMEAKPDLDALIKACANFGKGANLTSKNGNGVLLRKPNADERQMLKATMAFAMDVLQ